MARGTRTPVPILTAAQNPYLVLDRIPNRPGIYPTRVQLTNESAATTNIYVKTEVADGDERITTKNGAGEGYELLVPGGSIAILDNVRPGKVVVSADTDGTLLTWKVSYEGERA